MILGAECNRTWEVKLLEPKCNSGAKHLSACCSCAAQLCQHPCDLEGTAPPSFTYWNCPLLMKSYWLNTAHSKWILIVGHGRHTKNGPILPTPKPFFTAQGFLAGRACRSVTCSSSLLRGTPSLAFSWSPPAVHCCRMEVCLWGTELIFSLCLDVTEQIIFAYSPS